ncbi:MAG: hypothetical protein Kow0069_19900 [Promethearchaeota archaeon]
MAEVGDLGKAVVHALDLVARLVDKVPLAHASDLSSRVKRLRKRVEGVGDPDRLARVLTRVRGIVAELVPPPVHAFVGGHGGVVVDDFGYCEFDAPRLALERLVERVERANSLGVPYLVEVAPCVLEWASSRFPDLVAALVEALRAGPSEFVNPAHSQPYALLLGPESTLRQFEFGFQVLDDLGLPCGAYWPTEASTHPQLPGVLRAFGVRVASLRSRLLGSGPSSPGGLVEWEGLDGSSVLALTDQPGVFNGEYFHGTFYRELPSLLFQLAAKPTTTRVLLSCVEDVVMTPPGEDEVWRTARWRPLVTFESPTSFALGDGNRPDGVARYRRDEFQLSPKLGVASDLLALVRRAEGTLLAFEALHAAHPSAGLAVTTEELERTLDDAWRALLVAQAHDCYAVPNVRPGDYSFQQLDAGTLARLGVRRGGPPIHEAAAKQLARALAALRDCFEWSWTSLEGAIPAAIKKKVFAFNPTCFTRPVGLDEAFAPFSGAEGVLGYLVPWIMLPRLRFFSSRTFDLGPDGRTFHWNEHASLRVAGVAHWEPDPRHAAGWVVKRPGGRSLTLIAALSFDGGVELALEGRAAAGGEVAFEFDQLDGAVVRLNYAFGVEPTRRRLVQSLDGLLVTGAGSTGESRLAVLHVNVPWFRIDRRERGVELAALLGRGSSHVLCLESLGPESASEEGPSVEFSFARAASLHSVPLVAVAGSGTSGAGTFRASPSALQVAPPFVVTSVWRRNGRVFCRAWNCSGERRAGAIEGDLAKSGVWRVSPRRPHKRLERLDADSVVLDGWAFDNLELGGEYEDL